MSDYKRSGEYELIKAVLITNTANKVELDVSGSFVDIIVYESIYDNTMSGSITLVDSYNLIQRYALGNMERILLEWQTAGMSESIGVESVVYDLTGPHEVSGHTAGYTLHFCSPEFINSMRDKVFNGYVDTSANIVDRLFNRIARKDEFKPKKIIVDPTRNIEHIVYTGEDVIRAIQICCENACAATGTSGTVFYENNAEFRYTTLEELYTQEPITEFVYKDSATYDNVDNIAEESFNTVQNFEIDENNKFMDNLMDGQFGSSWGYLGLKDKSLNIYNYDSDTDFQESKSLGSRPNMKDGLINAQHIDKLHIAYSMDHEQNEQHVFRNRMKLLKSNSYSLSIGVFGNSGLKVGNVCIAKVPSYSQNYGPDTIDTLSGKFLISSIKHILDAKQYTQRLQLVKDSYEESIA